MKRAMPVAAALLLSACIGNRPADPVRYFVLDSAPVPAQAHTCTAVIVEPTTAASFYGTNQIAYSDMPGVRARYRYSFWTERPQQVIYAALQARLQCAGGESQLLLDTHVDDLYHDAGTAPGVVQVAVTARLRRLGDHELVASRRFARSAPAASYDAQGAVAGMRQAVGTVLDDIVGWVQQYARQTARPACASRRGLPVSEHIPAAPV
jgi:cholesterol transport system auxiliary component